MKQQIIFMIGSDRCGKTHIAAELSKRLEIPVFKASNEHENFLKSSDKFVMSTRYSDTRMLDFLKQTGHSVIFDRGYPCEIVYSQYFDRQADHQVLRYLDESYAKLGAIHVFCRRSSYNGIADDLDPSRLNSTALSIIDHKYWEFVKFYTRCKVITLVVDDENLDREVEEIMRQL